jgi:hypothetical protein
MDLLEYPIEYHKPVEGEKQIVFCVICIAMIGFIWFLKCRKGAAFTVLVPSARH